jgi:uncharacterized protein YkuJ
MSQLLSLGAINKITGEYVYPKIANKKDKYICPECNKDLILCQGEIRVHHFRHKVDSVYPCHHYSNPSETQIHKDAKILLKNLLERKIPISLIRKCCFCKKNEEFEIPEISETSRIELEYRFEYNGLKIADVAYLDNNDILCIFEICNTHKTCSENRPEPWFEIDAKTLIRIVNDITLSQIQIPCIRCEKCEGCIEIENSNKEKSILLLEKWFPICGAYQCPDIYPFEFRDYSGSSRDLYLTENFDLLLFDKCNPKYAIDLTNKNYSLKLQKECFDMGIEIYYINIDWILQQTNVPKKIECIKIKNYLENNANKEFKYYCDHCNGSGYFCGDPCWFC